MHYKLFSIGPVSIYSYGLFIGIGFLAAGLLAYKRAPKFGLDPEEIVNLLLVCIISGLLGAKLLYLITDIKSLLAGSMSIADFANGFVVYGGIAGGMAGIVIYCLTKKLDLWAYLDIASPSLPLGQAFGRIGCLMAGCCYGRETNLPIGITFHDSPFAPNGVKLLPTQIISSAGDFLILFIMLKIAAKKPKSGTVTSCYFILYGIGRMLVEFLRDDPRGTVAFLSTSQFISVFSIIFGFVMLRYTVSRGRMKKKEVGSGAEVKKSIDE